MTGPARLAIGAATAAILAPIVGGPVGLAVASAAVAGVAISRATGRPLGLESGRSIAAAAPLAIGALLVCLRIALVGPPPAAAPLPAGAGPWEAVVESVGSPRAGSRPAVVVLEDPPGIRLAATLPWYPEVTPGDLIRIDGTPEAVRANDDYGEYLARIGASGTIRARTLELASSDPAGDGPTWERARSAAGNALRRALPEPEAGLAAGILVGLRDRVDRDLAAAFTTAGASHVIAISGWNIAIVATTLGALTGRLGRRRRAIATGLAIAGYVAFVGPSASVVRAGAMAGCALLARELGRPTSAMSALGIAVTTLLMVDPRTVDDAGFQLSVLATAGLIGWGTGLSRRLAGPTPGRIRAWLAEALGVSLAAQAATLPVILLDFGRLSVVSPAVNLVVAPIVAPAMTAGALGLVGGLVALAGGPPTVATLIGLPAWALLGTLVAIVRLGASLPFSSLGLEPPANAIAAALAAGALAVAVRGGGRLRTLVGRRAGRPVPRLRRPAPHAAGRQGRRAAVLGIAAATLAIGLAAAHRPDGTTRITVLDIGQGDAILVEGGAGSRLLVDGGPDPGRLLIALDERLPPWDRHIDAVVLTHPHEDHVAGLAELLTRYEVSRVFEPGMIGPGPGYAAWQAQLSAGGTTRWALGTGDGLTIDEVSLRVLWPDPGEVPLRPADGGTAINNVSIVLLGETGGHRFLLTGDIEQAIDPRLIARGLPTVDFLKVAHHGSGTATTQAFLDAARPRVAVVSAGAGNPYGHPAPATVERLGRIAERVLRTDRDGSVTVTFDGSGMRVRAAGARRSATVSGGVAAVAPAAGVSPSRSPFLCGVPASPLAARVATGGSTTRSSATGASPTGQAQLRLPHPAPAARPWSSPRYHRLDDGPVQGGGGAPAPVTRPTRLAPAAFARGGRDRGLARAARCGRGPAPRRGSRAPPRRGQAPRAR